MEGKKVRDTNSFTRKRGYALKIISDFDDTIVCSGATPKFAGCDNRLPRKAIYPGVLTLWKELDHCFTKSLRTSMIPVMNVSSEKEARASATILSVPAEADGARIPACQQAGSNIILLSARPRSYKGWSEAAFYSAVIKPLVKSGRLYCLPVLLMGSVGSILQAIVMYFTRQTLIPGFNGIKHIVYQMLGERKVQNFKAFSDCYPESSFLFFGDNGQGDVYFAEAVNSLQELESDEAEEHGRLFASFIHIVRPLAQTVSASCTQCGACEREHLLGSMLDADCHMHETHVAMATKCLSLQLIDEGSLVRVIRDAINEFRFIMAKYPDQRDRWSRYARAMKRDVLEGLKAVSEDMRLGTDELKYLDVE
ncbi:unnamed protein product [Ostreobium quekettii]|uniref:Uncharacterized protein n=1 Tax=Ostreobium quekettii TaxID=121088 RepID=A0A8S1J8W1_9CHLO|nr:unnamed protein product [Ostreobium quekettii]